MRRNLFSTIALGPMTAREQRAGRYLRGPDDHPTPLTAQLTKHFEAVEAKIGPLSGDMKELQARFQELEQRAVRRGGPSAGGDAGPSWGQRFVDQVGSDLSSLKDNRNGRLSMQVNAAITSDTSGDSGSAGALSTPFIDRDVAGLPMRRLTIRDLLTVIPVGSGSVEYVKRIGRTNNAEVVAEGAQKPESSLAYELKGVSIRTIAHWMKASRQIIDDVKQLKAEIDADLRYGLALVEEAELLFGDGTGQHLFGMVPQAVEFAPAFDVTDLTETDVIGLAILQATKTDLLPDGIVIHPTDWWRMRLTKDANGKYILGDPGVPVKPSLFGLPVVSTMAMDEGNFLVGPFKEQRLYDRWEARVEMAFVNDDFTRNLVTILGEERVGFAAKQAEAMITGAFGAID